MPVAIPTLSPASVPPPSESATPATGGAAPEEGGEGAFAHLFGEAIASPASRAAEAGGTAPGTPEESQPSSQVTDPSTMFGFSPGLPSPLPVASPSDAAAASALAVAASAVAAASAGAAVAGATMPGAVPPGASPTRSERASGVAEAGAAGAASVAEPSAARTAADGMRLPSATPDGESRPGLGERAESRLTTDPGGKGLAGPAIGSLSAGAGEPQPLGAPSGGSATAPAPASLAHTVVGTPVGRPEWGGAIGERIGWLASQRVQVAEIQLTPAHLGPVEVRITIDRDVATIALAAAHAPVREALQASLPRLAEALAGGGLQLGQASVGADAFLGGSPQDRGAGRGFQASSSPPTPAAAAVASARTLHMQALGAAMARGGIDLFA